jgi:YD repeat-containing protein
VVPNDEISRRETLQAGSQGLITYGYDADDNRVSILQNGATATLTYDALDRMSQQSLPATPNLVTTTWSFNACNLPKFWPNFSRYSGRIMIG